MWQVVITSILRNILNMPISIYSRKKKEKKKTGTLNWREFFFLAT